MDVGIAEPPIIAALTPAPEDPRRAQSVRRGTL